MNDLVDIAYVIREILVIGLAVMILLTMTSVMAIRKHTKDTVTELKKLNKRLTTRKPTAPQTPRQMTEQELELERMNSQQ